MEIYRSKILKLNFRKTETGYLFEDRVSYTFAEIEKMKNSTPEEIKNIHEAKFVFSGELVSPEEIEKIQKHIVSEGGNNFTKAVQFAADSIKSGIKGKDAIFRASEKYNISPSSIGAELGKHKRG